MSSDPSGSQHPRRSHKALCRSTHQEQEHQELPRPGRSRVHLNLGSSHGSP